MLVVLMERILYNAYKTRQADIGLFSSLCNDVPYVICLVYSATNVLVLSMHIKNELLCANKLLCHCLIFFMKGIISRSLLSTCMCLQY